MMNKSSEKKNHYYNYAFVFFYHQTNFQLNPVNLIQVYILLVLNDNIMQTKQNNQRYGFFVCLFVAKKKHVIIIIRYEYYSNQ